MSEHLLINERNKKEEKNKNNRSSDFLKKGFLDSSLEMNSLKIDDGIGQVNKSTGGNIKTSHTKRKNKNFILKSELFSSSDCGKKIKSEEITPKSGIIS